VIPIKLEALPPDRHRVLPHIVAFWTGRILTIQWRRYMEEDVYLPHVECGSGGIGTLSSHGQAALTRYAFHAVRMAWR
jgi:hypothetical protein